MIKENLRNLRKLQNVRGLKNLVPDARTFWRLDCTSIPYEKN